MKRVVSISLGSSSRDHAVSISIKGESYKIERIGTDGSMKKMIHMIRELDGKVDAFGLGGMDMYVYAVDRRYEFRDARKIYQAAKLTPIVDGSGLKNTLERRSIEKLAARGVVFNQQKSVLLVSAMDRLGMAQAFENAGFKMTYGDLLFVVGLPVPLYSLKTLAVIARMVVPFLARLPFTMIYPTGKKQVTTKPRFKHIFEKNDIIAGDFHMIRRYMPDELPGKIIVTNTVTADDLCFLKKHRVKTLVTTTPEMEGRSFGTNVMEALMVCMAGGKSELSESQYYLLLEELDLKPRIVDLSG